MADADCIRLCRQCSAELPFKTRKSGRKRLYCSDLCRSRASSLADKSMASSPPPDRQCTFDGCGRLTQAHGLCVTHYNRMRVHGDPSVNLKMLRIDKLCGWCANVMRLKPAVATRKAYCSRTCAMHGRVRVEGKAAGGLVTFTCKGCAATVTRKWKNGTDFCTVRCRGRHRTLLSREAFALRRIAENWKPEPNYAVEREIAALRRIARYKSKGTTVRPCAHCGAKCAGIGEYKRICVGCKQLVRAKDRAIQRKSEAGKARKREDKARRRALTRGAAADRIDPIKVFDRDKWRCHLCGCKTPRELRGSYSHNAPELDHVVPLSKGGAHTWGNVKCACRACNGAKSDKPMGQLGLELAA